MEAVVSDHSAQSPSSVCVASPGHAMGHCKLKKSLCGVQKLWRSLYCMLWQGVSRLFVEVAVLWISGDFQVRRQ